jgi:hypothetical protein
MRTSSREIPAAGEELSIHDLKTVRFAIPIEDQEVPYLTANMDIALRPLRPFEAYVASFIDGTQSVAALAEASKLPAIEIKVVLKAFIERRMVELHRQPAPRPPEDALPLLEGEEFLEDAPLVPPPPPPEAIRAEPRPHRLSITIPPAPPPSKPLTASPVPSIPPVAPAPSSQPAPKSEDFLQRAVRFDTALRTSRSTSEATSVRVPRSSSPAPTASATAPPCSAPGRAATTTTTGCPPATAARAPTPSPRCPPLAPPPASPPS